VVVGIEATGAMQWFLELLEELGIVCRVGHPAKIRAAETRKQKHDRRDARLMLDLLMRADGFPEIWMPSSEQRDLRTPAARPSSVGEDTNPSTEHIASHSAQSRTAARPEVCGLQPGRRHCKPCLCPATAVKGETNCCAYTCNF